MVVNCGYGRVYIGRGVEIATLTSYNALATKRGYHKCGRSVGTHGKPLVPVLWDAWAPHARTLATRADTQVCATGDCGWWPGMSGTGAHGYISKKTQNFY